MDGNLLLTTDETFTLSNVTSNVMCPDCESDLLTSTKRGLIKWCKCCGYIQNNKSVM